MPGHLPNLDKASLLRLRSIVDAMHSENGKSLQMKKLISLASVVELEGGLTIDFDASRELGSPMVVLRFPGRDQSDPRLECLSKREHEVAEQIALGLSNKEIAKTLFISLSTVKDHVHNILKKTNLPNRAGIAASCRGEGGADGRNSDKSSLP